MSWSGLLSLLPTRSYKRKVKGLALTLPVRGWETVTASLCAREESRHISIDVLPPPDWGCALAIHLGAGHSTARGPCSIYVLFDVIGCERFGVLLWHSKPLEACWRHGGCAWPAKGWCKTSPTAQIVLQNDLSRR